MAKRKIGMLDSGIGGMSVLAYARAYLGENDYLYYADTDHVPYGTKTREEILSYVDTAVRFLLPKGVDAIVIACNTATSIAVDEMRKRYDLPIVGIEPAVKPAAEHSKSGKILVTATAVTIRGERLHSLIAHTGSHPDLVALPKLVTFAESGIFDLSTVSAYLRESVSSPEEYDEIVLGCTHFSFFRDAYEAVFPNAEIIDGNYGTVHQLSTLLGEKMTLSSPSGSVAFYQSGREVTDEDTLAFYRSLEERIHTLQKNRRETE